MRIEISSLFNPSAVTLIPISYSGSSPNEILRVPTGNPADLAYVEAGTIFTIFLSFCFLLRAAFFTACRVNRASPTKAD